MDATTTPKPFVATGWLRMTDAEQGDAVRPFYSDYLAVLAEIEAAGAYPYNASFKGRIAGIDPATTGTTLDDEDTAIYLLQQLHSRERDEARRDAFLASGGVPVASVSLDEGKSLRGTVARFGWYSGGTGWQELADVRLVQHPRRPGQFAFIPKGKHLPRTFDGGAMYFRADVAKGA